MTSAAVAMIRASALQQNLATVRRLAPKCAVMAVIKANAYGHGLVDVARILGDADALAVARMREAIVLREAGVNSTVVCLSGFSDVREVNIAREHDIQVVVHSGHQIDLLEQISLASPLRIWLKIDSGMGRLGVPLDEAQAAIKRLVACGNVSADFGLMTHLACADEQSNPMTAKQIDEFGQAIGSWRGDISVANSAAILGWPDSLSTDGGMSYAGKNWVRPGLMLYGASPFLGKSGLELGLRPAMSLQAPVISVRKIGIGETVGYGASWRAKRATRLAVFAVGYGDGMPWRVGQAQGSVVAMNGKLAPIVGRVSMDLVSVDVTDLPAVCPGDMGEFWGEQVPIESLAEFAGTIPYELMTGVSARVDRQVVD